MRAIWRPTTVEQVFLDSQINLCFPKHLQEAQWLAVLFAVGVDESHAAFAKGLQRIRLQSNSRGILTTCTTTSFPCLVLLGLDYSLLKDAEIEKLKQFLDLTWHVPLRVREHTPITYGECRLRDMEKTG